MRMQCQVKHVMNVPVHSDALTGHPSDSIAFWDLRLPVMDRGSPKAHNRMSDCRKAFPAILMAAAWIIVTALPALAHGVLQSALPPANASLDASPREIALGFSEAVDSAFSTVVVLDREGRQVTDRPVFSRDGRRITVPVVQLARGIYTVRWRVLSAVDGHTTTGFYAFAVGQAMPADLGAVRAAAPPPTVVVFRWIGLISAILLAGTAFFQVAVLHPSLAVLRSSEAVRLARSSDDRLRALTVIGALVLLVSLGVEFVLQAMILLDAPLRGLFASGTIWRLLGTTRAGWGVLVRTSAALVLLLPSSAGGRILRMAALIWFVIVGGTAAMLGGLSAFTSTHVALLVLVASVYGLVSALMALILPQIPDLHMPQGRWVAPVAGAILLAGITTTAHAAGNGPIAAFADWLHLGAVALWIGGLLSLLLVLQLATPADRLSLARALISRFSTVAGICLGVLAVTGIYSAWLDVPSLQAFRVTAYGQALLIKLVLIVPLVALGALNRFVIRPRLEADSGQSTGLVQRRFVRLVAAEGALGTAILLVVAILTITPPARVSMPAGPQRSLALAGIAGELSVRLTVTPALPGWNRMEILVSDPRGKSLGADDRVVLHLLKLDENLDGVTIPLSLRRGDQYVAEGAQLGLPGWWEVEVVIRRLGGVEVSTSFALRFGNPPRFSDVEAVRLLRRARAAMSAVRTWRQVDQIADGVGHVIVTRYELSRPDRLRYRTSLGGEAVLIGTTRYVRENSLSWQQDTLSQPVVLRGPYLEYLAGAEAIRRGRQAPCEGESCQIILWDAPRQTAAFAGWVGLQTLQVHKLLMVAPAHYMTSYSSDLNGPIIIKPPQ